MIHKTVQYYKDMEGKKGPASWNYIGAGVLAGVVCLFIVLATDSYTLPSLSNKKLYEDLRSTLIDSIKEVGAAQAYKDFLENVEESPIEEHAQAHIFGEALYDVLGLEGVSVCDTSLRFGCYHSFFGRVIHDKGIEMLPELDALCRKNFGMDTKCQHGLGHGILVYVGYENLLQGLELCESITDVTTGGCLGGVFMEYNFHTMENSSEGQFVRPLQDDPYEPCNKLPERFHAACYLEQVQWWEWSMKADSYVYMGTLCSTLPKESGAYASCFRGIGTHYSPKVLFDYEKIHALCMKMPHEEGIELCHEGVTWLIVGVEEYKDLYDLLCEELKGDARDICRDRWGTVELF